ncbi:hypothetical protein [Rhodopseudomonas sp. B29]|uniref:hypothetical protein n=1 Tax=Rhodopseudomonas sp. B29 TaxID=95607 RepID=UPI000346BDA9|nr:hypothetical protein [Rhodopseudomonas sp. B29]
MTGSHKPSKLSLVKSKPEPKPPTKDVPKTPAPEAASDDDLYETGDICGPARDRDDEQRGL